MEIHQLEYVLALAKYHHFSHAADEICVAQSTLSQQVGKLEEELGVLLFQRTTRTVNLTPAGREFITYAMKIMAEIHQAKQAMQDHITVERGEISIGAIPIIGILGLTSLIASFQKSYPNLHVELLEDASGRLIELLQASEIDVAFLTPPSHCEQYENLAFYPVIQDELVLVVNQGHSLAKKKIMDLGEAKSEKYICMKPNYGMLRISLEACHNAGFEPNVVYQSSQVETIMALVAEGLGVALLTTQVAKSLKKPSISIIKIYNAPKRITALAIPQRNHLNPAVNAFYAFTMQFCRARSTPYTAAPVIIQTSNYVGEVRK
jgi:LysR family hydrogen peroxide-inducible transcriptional activator